MPIIHAGTVEMPKPEIAMAVREYSPDDEKFAADRILPPTPSQVESGTVPVIQREDALRIENTRRAPGANFARVDFREEGLEFKCRGYGAECKVPDETRAIYRHAFDAELEAGYVCKSILMREREARVAAAILNGSTWTGAALTTDVSGTAPFATVGSDVVTAVNGAIEKVQLNSGLIPNALIANTVNVNRLIANTVIRARFPGAAIITRQMLADALAAIFGITTLVECGAVKNDAAEGQAHSGAYIWSSTYVQVARLIPEGAPVSTPGLGRTMKWGGLMGVDADMNVVMYRESQSKSDVLQSDWYIDELIFGTAYAHMLKVA